MRRGTSPIIIERVESSALRPVGVWVKSDMAMPDTTVYEFGPFSLETAERRLLRDGRPVLLTAKLFDILLLLVRNGGRVVTKETLMNEIWSDSFVEENNLTVSISSLRKILGERYGERKYIETVTKRGYRFVARVGRVRGEGAAPASLEQLRAGGDEWRVGGFDEAVSSLVVLPFLNVSKSSDLDYLSDGITENIIISLSRLPRLRVMARSTAFRYKGRELDVRKVGRELKVQTALVGRLREFKGRLLLGVELVDTRDGSQVWGESYNRPLSGVLRVQEEIASEISGKLRIELSGEERARLTKRHTESSEAYHLYLKGRYFWNKSSLNDIERSIKYFEESLGYDPDYSLAHAGLADCYIRLGYLNEIPFNDSIPAIRREAARAVALDETLAEAHCSLGYAEVLSLHWPEAEKEFRRAIELNPNSALARRHYAFLLVICGRREEAVAEMERALQLDPLTPRMRLNAASVFYYARRYERSIEECRLVLEMEPGFGYAHGILALNYERLGMYKQAIAEVRKGLEVLREDPEMLSILGYLYAVTGKRREAKRMLNELMKLSGQKYVAPLFIAVLHTGLKETEKTFEWLERALEDRSYIAMLKAIPFFAPLRRDPRFTDLLRRCGFPS